MDDPFLSEHSTPDLVADLAAKLSALVARHAELAKTEAIAQVKQEIRMASSLGAAALLAYAGLIFLLATGALALALVLPGWAATLIVAGATLALSGILALLGYRSRVRSPLRETRRTVKEDMRWLTPRTA